MRKASRIDRLDMSLVYRLSLENISGGHVSIKSRTGDLSVRSSNPEVESMVKNQLEQLSYATNYIHKVCRLRFNCKEY